MSQMETKVESFLTNRERKKEMKKKRWSYFLPDETGDDTFMLRCGLDADVHTLIDEQIKLKTSFSSYFFLFLLRPRRD